MPVYRYMNHEPLVAADAYLAPGSVVIGNATIGAGSSVWFNAVVRGDEGQIIIGEGSNIQDLSILHTDSGHVLSIGDGVTIGHRCVIHGCTIGDGCLIGMGAIVMNGAVIGRGSLVAAGAVVLENMQVPPFSLVTGVPAIVRKTLDEKISAQMGKAAGTYRHLAEEYGKNPETSA